MNRQGFEFLNVKLYFKILQGYNLVIIAVKIQCINLRFMNTGVGYVCLSAILSVTIGFKGGPNRKFPIDFNYGPSLFFFADVVSDFFGSEIMSGISGSLTPIWKRTAKASPMTMQISAKFRNLSASAKENPVEENSAEENPTEENPVEGNPTEEKSAVVNPEAESLVDESSKPRRSQNMT